MLKYNSYTTKSCGCVHHEIVLVDIKKAITLPILFREEDVDYEIVHEELLDYVIHRYCPIMTFRTDITCILDTYADLYEVSPTLIKSIITNQIGVDNFYTDVDQMIKQLEQQVKEYQQSDLYQQGRVDY